jgi:hypothetical protein
MSSKTKKPKDKKPRQQQQQQPAKEKKKKTTTTTAAKKSKKSNSTLTTTSNNKQDVVLTLTLQEVFVHRQKYFHAFHQKELDRIDRILTTQLPNEYSYRQCIRDKIYVDLGSYPCTYILKLAHLMVRFITNLSMEAVAERKTTDPNIKLVTVEQYQAILKQIQPLVAFYTEAQVCIENTVQLYTTKQPKEKKTFFLEYPGKEKLELKRQIYTRWETHLQTLFECVTLFRNEPYPFYVDVDPKANGNGNTQRLSNHKQLSFEEVFKWQMEKDYDVFELLQTSICNECKKPLVHNKRENLLVCSCNGRGYQDLNISFISRPKTKSYSNEYKSSRNIIKHFLQYRKGVVPVTSNELFLITEHLRKKGVWDDLDAKLSVIKTACKDLNLNHLTPFATVIRAQLLKLPNYQFENDEQYNHFVMMTLAVEEAFQYLMSQPVTVKAQMTRQTFPTSRFLGHVFCLVCGYKQLLPLFQLQKIEKSRQVAFEEFNKFYVPVLTSIDPSHNWSVCLTSFVPSTPLPTKKKNQKSNISSSSMAIDG